MPPKMRPIRVFGIVMLCMAAVSLLFFGNLFLSPGSKFYIHGANPPEALSVWFVVIVSAFYVAVGIGTLGRRRWGYVLMKAMLYLLVLSFPIGTIIGWWLLRHIRRHNLRQQFGFDPRPAAV